MTFDGMAKVCAEAAGITDPKIVHYDPKSIEAWGVFFGMARSAWGGVVFANMASPNLSELRPPKNY